MSDDYCQKVVDRLISFWEFHRGFDADIAGLSRFVNVSRDTAYRWLNRKSIPKPSKALLIEEWLNRRATD